MHEEKVLEAGIRTDYSGSFCVRMAQGAAPVVVDSLADPDYADLEHAEAIRSYAGVRLTDDQGELFGLMGGLLSAHLATARAADRSRREGQIGVAIAQTDDLTGLTNRRGWNSLAQDAQQRLDAYGDQVAVAVIDLDHLKSVNDTDGHSAGDALITHTASTLAACAKAGDRVARYGGDGLVILSNGVAAADLAQYFGVFALALDKAGISASFGFSATRPGAVSVDDAFAEADRAMYTAKASRQGSTQPRNTRN